MTQDIPNARLSKVLEAPLPLAVPSLPSALEELSLSVDRFCLLAGVEALGEMLAEDAEALCGPRHARRPARRGYRWGTTVSEVAYQGGKVKVSRPRVRDLAGKEMSLASWELLSDPDLLRAWATNLMVLNVSTRKYRRAVRLPEGDLASARGDATSKSAVSRRFVALTRKKLKAWLASDLSAHDLLVIQIDGLHVGDHVLVAAIGVDGAGDKQVLGIAEGATENAATVQALIDNLIARGLDPEIPRLFIVDGSRALSKAVRNTFGIAAAVQRCQVHKGRNITERLDEHLHAGVKKALRQAWDQDDAEKAERLLRNLARRLEHDAPGVSGSILEGLDEILTVIRLGLPPELRRALACTNAIENALGTVRTVSRNVKRWRNAEMALRWTAAGLLEAQKTFRRLKAYRQLPMLRKALEDNMKNAKAKSALDTVKEAA
jgi:transposase-like protein